MVKKSIVISGLLSLSMAPAQTMEVVMPTSAQAVVGAATLCVCCLSQLKGRAVKLLSPKEKPSIAPKEPAEQLPIDDEELCCERVITAPCKLCNWLMGPLDERTVVYYEVVKGKMVLSDHPGTGKPKTD